VEHGYTLDEAAVALMAEKGVWYIPTLSVTHDSDYMRRMGWSEQATEKALNAAVTHRQGFEMARAAGVHIASGSDLHPLAQSSVSEIAQLVRCGMSEWEAIVAATRSAAQLCGADADLGTIEAGKKADLIVVPHNPLDDIGHLRSIAMVILDGRLVHQDSGQEGV
jgi:imidazolonepropionase-like amidohydrolase